MKLWILVGIMTLVTLSGCTEYSEGTFHQGPCDDVISMNRNCQWLQACVANPPYENWARIYDFYIQEKCNITEVS